MMGIKRREWAIIHDAAEQKRALGLARGCYQRALLRGDESLSGSTLTGAAAQWGGRYAASRRALLERLTAAGVPWGEVTGPHGARLLVLGQKATNSESEVTP